MLADILITILLIASTFYLTIVLLRFLLQLARADFYNPISQFVVKATNPLLRPLRKLIPGWGGIDGASLVLAIIIQAVTFVLILIALNGGLPAINPITLVVWSVLNVLDLIVKIYFWSVIAIVDCTKQWPPCDPAHRADHRTGDAPRPQPDALHGRPGPVTDCRVPDPERDLGDDRAHENGRGPGCHRPRTVNCVSIIHFVTVFDETHSLRADESSD